MGAASRFDSLTADQLRARGSMKWTRFPDAIGAFVAEMDFGVAEPVERALHDAVSAAAFGYLPDATGSALSEAAADWFADHYHWTVDPAMIRPVADVLSALDVVLDRFGDVSAPVVLPTPAYMPFLRIPPRHGRELIEVPMIAGDAGYVLDLEAIERALAPRGGLLILCNPCNPVGRVFRTEELQAVAEVVARTGARVFSDEIHAPLVYPGHRHIPYASVSDATAAHTITATSASKAWNLPGLKCAQLVFSNDDDLHVWTDGGAAMAAAGPSNLGVVASTAAYRDGGSWLAEVIAYLDSNRMALRDALRDRLPAVGYLPPEGTYIAWLDWRRYDLGGSAAAVLLREAGVALTDGALCGAAGRGFTRLVFATPRPILVEAVERMATAVHARV